MILSKQDSRSQSQQEEIGLVSTLEAQAVDRAPAVVVPDALSGTSPGPADNRVTRLPKGGPLIKTRSRPWFWWIKRSGSEVRLPALWVPSTHLLVRVFAAVAVRW